MEKSDAVKTGVYLILFGFLLIAIGFYMEFYLKDIEMFSSTVGSIAFMIPYGLGAIFIIIGGKFWGRRFSSD